MKSVNEVTLLGNLGANPEHKFTPTGTSVATFNMATNRKWKDKQTGQDKEKVNWHRVVLWKGLADIAAKYLEKGDPVYVKGELSQRSYEKDGETRYITEVVARDIVLLGTPSGNGGSKADEFNKAHDTNEVTDEDIPF